MLVNAEFLSVGLWVRVEAKPGREADLDTFLRGAAPLAQAEPATVVWFAVRLGPAMFAIFDAFRDEDGRERHLAGRIAAALAEHASTLLAGPPVIERVDVLAAKLPVAS
jgi:quinol monooxygenase YgiN